MDRLYNAGSTVYVSSVTSQNMPWYMDELAPMKEGPRLVIEHADLVNEAGRQQFLFVPVNQ